MTAKGMIKMFSMVKEVIKSMNGLSEEGFQNKYMNDPNFHKGFDQFLALIPEKEIYIDELYKNLSRMFPLETMGSFNHNKFCCFPDELYSEEAIEVFMGEPVSHIKCLSTGDKEQIMNLEQVTGPDPRD